MKVYGDIRDIIDLIDKDKHFIESEFVRKNQSKRVLFIPSYGLKGIEISLECLLAISLKLRGINTELMVCDNILEACQITHIHSVDQNRFYNSNDNIFCDKCFSFGNEILSGLGLPIHVYSQWINPADIEYIDRIIEQTELTPDSIRRFQFEGLSIGEHCYAGALRFFTRADMNNESQAEIILGKFLRASLITFFVMKNLIRDRRYNVVCFNHGIYVPQGIIGEFCRKEGIRVVNWNPTYKAQTYIFSHHDSYHHTMIDEPVSTWEKLCLSYWGYKRLDNYLKSRRHGTQDWIWFHEKPQQNFLKIVRTLGIDTYKPCIGLLTNVMWDAQLHYKSNAFSSMLHWILDTIDYFRNRPDLQLIIRIHPAEIRGTLPSRQKVAEEIATFYPKLPSNVFVILPETDISTYTVMEKCDAVLIYNTKTGIELSSIGIPVIVAGEAWIRNKGFSADAVSPEHYFQFLDELPYKHKMSQEQITRARKYAFHFFFRRMLYLPFIKKDLSLSLKSIRQLIERQSPGLDVICDGIVTGTPFIYPAELDHQVVRYWIERIKTFYYGIKLTARTSFELSIPWCKK